LTYKTFDMDAVRGGPLSYVVADLAVPSWILGWLDVG